jgi:hypothetical protein
MARRSGTWMCAWGAGSALVLSGLTAYLVHVGLDQADKLFSCLGLLLAVGTAAMSLLPKERAEGSPGPGEPVAPVTDVVEGTGKSVTSDGATAVTGAQVTDNSHPVQVSRTGDAEAHGPGSTSVSGIQRLPLGPQ